MAARTGLSWRRSAGVRFGLIYAALLGISVCAVAGFLWWSTAGALERQTDWDITSDADNLRGSYQRGGLDALVAAIDQRINNNVDGDAIYVLADASMRVIAGTFDHWPKRLNEQTEWAELELDSGGLVVPARIHQFVVYPGSYHLLIGRDVRLAGYLNRLLMGALPWAGAIMVGLGLLGAITGRRLFGSMLANVSETASAISAGDFALRVRVTGRGDELDVLAETINDMLDRISRLMDGVREVSNAIAHDLRTPIARARARLEDAAREGASEADLRAAVDRGIADLDGLIAVFQALLRIAEIEAGARRSAFAAFDAAPLLRDLAELYEAAAEENRQTLELLVPDRLPVFGDRHMLQQAVANLLDNALKFSPQGGTVRILASHKPQGTVASIIVADEGPGIPDADRARATERFFRGEDARHAPGSGLGLALVQAVAALHGGALRLEDNRPGLRAVLTLPAATARMEALSPKPQPDAIKQAA